MIDIKPRLLEQDLEGKDVYLSKEGEDYFVGLHATGMTGEDGKFHNMEAWLNLYDLNRKFVCSQSRIFGLIEETAEEFIQDGWQIIADWKD